MFEIGTSLREARVRQGVDLIEAERSTKIRSKYLRALEDERFELLPAQTYVKGFLRSYADYLGLDGQLYVDEYNSRYVAGEEEAPLRTRRSGQSPAHRRVESSVLLVALAGIAAVTALVVIAARWSGDERTATPPSDLPITRPSETEAALPAPARQRWISIELTAQRGDSRVTVYRNTASGKLLYEGTLERGQSRPFAGRRLWLMITEPANLAARVDGRRVQLPGDGSRPIVAVATAAGIAPAQAG
jgi:cytoskeleton protein RodZ